MPSARKLKINLWKEELKAIAFVSVSFSNSWIFMAAKDLFKIGWLNIIAKTLSIFRSKKRDDNFTSDTT
jgi:hypothetical protein